MGATVNKRTQVYSPLLSWLLMHSEVKVDAREGGWVYAAVATPMLRGKVFYAAEFNPSLVSHGTASAGAQQIITFTK